MANLAAEIAGRADAIIGRHDAPDDGPDRATYLAAWHDERARIGAPEHETALLVRRYEWTRSWPRFALIDGGTA